MGNPHFPEQRRRSGPRLAIILALALLFAVIGLTQWLRKALPVLPATEQSVVDAPAKLSSDQLALRNYDFQPGGMGETLFRFLENGAPDYKVTVLVFKNRDFAADSLANDLKPEKKRELDDLAKVLQAFPDMRIEIAGHSDESEDMMLGFANSRKEAETVQQLLVARGIAPSRISIKGFGYTQPITDNSTPEAQAQNRRVELVITSL